MAKRNKLAVFSVVALGMMFFAEQNKACTRAVYLGPDDMIVTGRTMDWKEDPQSNIYLFPRGNGETGRDYGQYGDVDFQIWECRDCRI